MENNGRIIVIKVGTAPLTHSTGMLNIRKIEHLCRVICDLENSGANIILVSSGSISAGWVKMGLLKRPDTVCEKQAAAAIGQCELISMYDKYIISYGYIVAQILLTKEDVETHCARDLKHLQTAA